MNEYVVINNRPCKIVAYSTSKTGKHGLAKANITGLDLFDGKKHTFVGPMHTTLSVPEVNKEDWALISIDDDNMLTLQGESSKRSDIPLPPGELGNKIKGELGQIIEGSGRYVSVLLVTSMGINAVTSCRINEPG